LLTRNGLFLRRRRFKAEQIETGSLYRLTSLWVSPLLGQKITEFEGAKGGSVDFLTLHQEGTDGAEQMLDDVVGIVWGEL